MAAPFLTGQFLLAMPGIGDPRFERAVIAICAHDADGALGVGVGAEIGGLRLRDLLSQVDIPADDAPDAPVHFGGPVEVRRGFVLHSDDWSGPDSVAVAGRWSLTGTIDVLRAIAERRGPRRWTVALGYAGWGPGQLDAELTRPGWLTVAGEPALLFDTPAADRWNQALAGAGIDPRLLASGGGRA